MPVVAYSLLRWERRLQRELADVSSSGAGTDARCFDVHRERRTGKLT
jgi:hypothetical protein